MWTVDPKIPMSLWWALCIASLGAIVWYALRRDWPVPPLRRFMLTLLLALGVVGPLLIALNPTWVETIPPLPGNPMLTVLVDGTMSMKTEDMDKETPTSRWQRAVEIAGEVEQKRSTVEVRKLAFSDVVKPYAEPVSQPSSAEPDAERWPQGHRSDLGSALRQTTRTGSPLGHAILMISDGAHNVGAMESLLQSAREANALATPVYTVTLGTSIGMKNCALTAKSARMIAFPDTPIVIRASIGHNGLAGQTTQVYLLKDDKVLQTKSIRLSAEPVQEIKFTLQEGIAEPIERFRIVADEVPGEVTTADNQSTVLVQRLSAPIGVLVLEGKPYWDSKFLARNLARDPVVDMTSIVQLGPGRFLKRKVANVAEVDADDQDAAVASEVVTATAVSASSEFKIETTLASPLESMELLDAYRLVIIGRDAGVYLTESGVENLRKWISQSGGCLLCARGAPTEQVPSKLAEILPVRWSPGEESRVRAKVTQHGMDSAVFDPLMAAGSDPLGALPSLAIGSTPKQREGLPQVLMQSAGNDGDSNVPVVTYQPFGSGQTIVVEGAGMWRWAFLSPEHSAKDKIYPTLWQSLVQWIISQQDMMPGQEVAIRSDRAAFLSGDRATASVLLRDPAKWKTESGADALSVTIQAASEDLPKRVSLSPSGMEPGLFRADFGPLEIGFYTIKVVQGERDQVLAATAFEVRDPWFESLEVDARPDLMRQVARLSGGEVLQPDQVAGLVNRFEERIQKQQVHKEVRTTMWDRPIVLLMILGAWVSTWVIRRQSGLV